MRRYELMLLLRPDLEDDKLQAAVEKVTRAIVNGGGSLSKVSPWGKRRLAYDIGQHREASYFLIHFDIEPGQVREIERGMLITEEILRHLVTVLEDRGPADEIAPAAAPRSLDQSEPMGDTDAAADGAAAASPVAAFGDVAGLDAAGMPDANAAGAGAAPADDVDEDDDTSDDDTSDDDTSEDDTSEDTSEEDNDGQAEPGVEPTVEERAGA